ncbi:Probable pseudouridine synthase [gamma proteobacterium HdN1]|nr:Probable pseudouridine synthase [gamma proteobacterium HdN1]
MGGFWGEIISDSAFFCCTFSALQHSCFATKYIFIDLKSTQNMGVPTNKKTNQQHRKSKHTASTNAATKNRPDDGTSTTILLFHKPFGVICQFSRDGTRPTLANYISLPDIYAAGRLDQDSEGLLVLTNDGKLQQRITHPKHKLEKTYLAQVEGIISEEALHQLRTGIALKDGKTLPAKAQRIEPPNFAERIPPIRERKNIPTSWLELRICEGRNRQVRRMTAATGFPTLRLIRTRIGEWQLGELQPGEWCLTPS